MIFVDVPVRCAGEEHWRLQMRVHFQRHAAIRTIFIECGPSCERTGWLPNMSPDSIMEPNGRAWAIYRSVKSDIFGHADIGMAIVQFIKAPNFSYVPTAGRAVYLGCALLYILEFAYRPPAQYPDLFPVLAVLLSSPVFVFTWLWSIKSIIEALWTAGGLGADGELKEKEKKSGLRMQSPSKSLGSGQGPFRSCAS